MIQDILKETEQHMKKSVEHVEHEYQSLRSGRAHPSLVDEIKVEYYGTPTPLKQIASVSTPEARLIVIQPFDKTALGEIEKAIQKSDLSLNPNNDGKIIRLSLPHLTEDQRKDLVKVVHQKAEEARIAIRNIRRDANTRLDEAQKAGTPEDEVHRAHDKTQEMTNKYIKEIDTHMGEKEKEIMTV